MSDKDDPSPAEMARIRSIVASQLRGLARAVELAQCDFVSFEWDADAPRDLSANASLNLSRFTLIDKEYEDAKRFAQMVRDTASKLAKSPAPTPKVSKTDAPDLGDFVEDITDRLTQTRKADEADGEKCEDPDCFIHHPKPGSN